MDPTAGKVDESRVMTLEAFADTVVPGEKRFPGDRAIAGVSTGGGAVEAGALALLSMPEGGMDVALDGLAVALNQHAVRYRDEHGRPEDDSVPAFVALESADRIALIDELCRPGHPEKVIWTGIVLFCNMAYDTGGYMHTTDALAAGHVGLTALGFFPPDADGRWRFPDYSYRRPLADLHPLTLANGSLP